MMWFKIPKKESVHSSVSLRASCHCESAVIVIASLLSLRARAFLRAWQSRVFILAWQSIKSRGNPFKFAASAFKSLICLFVMFVVIPVQAETHPSSQQVSTTYPFLTLADIHFDPFLGCHRVSPCPLIQKLQRADVSEWPAILKAGDNDPPQYKQDTNYALLTTSLAAVKAEAAIHHVQFVIVLGDFLAHEFRHRYKKFTHDRSRAHYQLFVKKTLTFVNNEIAHTFPNINVYSVVGNNDSYHGDYYSSPHDFFNKPLHCGAA